MWLDVGWSEFGFPALLLGAVILIALATLALHLLFPPTTGKCPIKKIIPDEATLPKTNANHPGGGNVD